MTKINNKIGGKTECKTAGKKGGRKGGKKGGSSEPATVPINPPSADGATGRHLYTPSGFIDWLGGITNVFEPARSDLVNSSKINIESETPNPGNLEPYPLLEESIFKKSGDVSVRRNNYQLSQGESYIMTDGVGDGKNPFGVRSADPANPDGALMAPLNGGGKKKNLKKKKTLKRLMKKNSKTKKSKK